MNAGDVIARIIRINTLDDLFDSGPETQWILKESANLFFTDLNAILREYAILLVCRLTGPAKSFGKANLSTQRFTNLMRDSGCLTPEIEHLDAALREHRELLKPARNKIIAHSEVPRPSPLRRTIRARQTCFCGLLGAATIACNR